MYTHVEFLKYNPEDPETYPSVCHSPAEVKDRFDLEGGETLVFTPGGTYLGELIKQLGDGDE